MIYFLDLFFINSVRNLSPYFEMMYPIKIPDDTKIIMIPINIGHDREYISRRSSIKLLRLQIGEPLFSHLGQLGCPKLIKVVPQVNKKGIKSTMVPDINPIIPPFCHSFNLSHSITNEIVMLIFKLFDVQYVN